MGQERPSDTATRLWCAVGRYVICAAILVPLSTLRSQTIRDPGTSIHIEGVVRDNAGAAAAGARIRLGGSQALAEAVSGPDGRFSITATSAGDLVVRAETQYAHSAELTLKPNKGRECRDVILVLGAPASRSSGCLSDAGAGMEFSDAPNFSIAAVTDWTAAGGHGSDNVLRTTEALTRAAVSLPKPERGDGSSTSESARLEAEHRSALASSPRSFEANLKLGKFLLAQGRAQEAKPFLQAAHDLRRDDSAAEIELADALKECGDLQGARGHLKAVLARRPNADALRVQGEVEEKAGDPLAAVRAYEAAVREDPSEQNYFAWASELLLHRAVWQAKDALTAAVKRYPSSVRLTTALGTSLFACALYEEAATRLCEAIDLSPATSEPYELLGKAVLVAPNPLGCAVSTLAQFAKLQPTNPLASYYYAMALWRQNSAPDAQVEQLLERAVNLDGKCSEAHLQLGNLRMTRREIPKAIDSYMNAIAANPELAEAHYKLGLAYDRAGEHEKAKGEFELHETLQAKQKAAVEQQRREVKQFLVVQETPAPNSH